MHEEKIVQEHVHPVTYKENITEVHKHPQFHERELVDVKEGLDIFLQFVLSF